MQTQFVVPQFIDVEDKIFGPITARQFVILLVAGLVLFVTFKLADFALFIFLTAVIGGGSLIIAFVKINGQAFHYFLLNIVQTLRRPALRIWNKIYNTGEIKRLQAEGVVTIPEAAKPIPRLSYSRIRDLSLTVNTGGYYQAED
ncbi:MAG: PrgI family protein [Candidatus Magasanikbacteria bacterium]|nr:PrgI family protein [Candidatus Magasanikbacteria bacterium]